MTHHPATDGLTVVIYIRVSSEEQRRGYSLDAQREDLLNWAERRGWQVFATHEDPACSGRGVKDRPGYRAMMDTVRQGLVEAILVADTDRLHRHVAHEEAMYQELMRLGVKLFSLDERGEVDLDTARGRRDARRKAVDDAYYSERLSERTTRGKRARAEAGLWNGHPAFGYCRGDCHTCTDPNGPGYCPNHGNMPLGNGKHLVTHPKDGQGLHWSFEIHATGEYTDANVAAALNDAGHRTNNKYTSKPNAKRKGGPRPFTKDTVRDMLQNETYLGFVKYKGELFPGKHPPLVSQALFDASQAARRARSRSRKQATGGGSSRVYLLAGLLRCGECGGKLHSSGTKHHRYYRCYRAFQEPGACSQHKYARADLIEAYIEQLVLQLQLPEDWRCQVSGYLEGGPDLEEIERQRALLEARLERLKRLYLEGDVDEAEYDAERDKTRRELAHLVTPEAVSVERAATLLANFALLWEQATQIERKKMLSEIFQKIVIRNRVVVEVVPRAAFGPLFEKFGGKK